jgi:NADPH2:quinone reductase
MLAAYYERTGPARDVLTLGDVDTPVPGPGEVRVQLACSGVNPSDVKTRGGLRSTALPFARIVPHSDGAGVIDQVGSGVDRSRIGQRVWVWNAAWGRPLGTAAQFVVLPEAQAVALPPTIGFEQGACLGIPALTAFHAVHTHGGVVGKSVLVHGGAGAVGHCAIQFARIAGARRVIATVSSDEKAAVAREAGVDVVLNYRIDDVTARVLEDTDGKGVDRIIEVDLAANLKVDLSLVRQDGEIVVYGSGAPEIPIPFIASVLKNASFHFFIVYNLAAADRSRAITGLDRILSDGRLTTRIAARLPLSEIARAHELVEGGRLVGNVVIDIPPP